MNKLKRICAAMTAVCVLGSFAYASQEVKLAAEKPSIFNFFGLFKKEATPTAATDEVKNVTANKGSLTVYKDTVAHGTLSSSVNGTYDVTYVIAQPPKKGEITITDSKTGSFTYVPNDGATGTDSFIFSAMIETKDGEESDTAEVQIAITEKEEQPDDNEKPETPPNSKFVYQDMLGHWGEYSALKLADKNIMKGIEVRGKYYYYPDTLLTRADFTVLLMSALDIDVEKAREIGNPFADAADIPAWANLYAKAAYDAGIISGSLENGKLYFHPYDVLTRIEIIQILDKTIKPDTVNMTRSEYADMYLVPEWGRQAVQNMTDYGILKGYDDNTVRPYVKINRAMSAEFILQILNYRDENPVMMKQIYAKMNSDTLK